MGFESGTAFVRSEFSRLFAGQPRVYQAPGRINLIGEHIDYNGGHVLPATLDLFTWVAIAPRPGRTLRVHLCSEGVCHSMSLDELHMVHKGSSIEYVKAVAWALQQEGHSLGGCDILIFGNIPQGAGLSSSASLQTALALALLDSQGISIERSELARICHRAEVGYVGMQCGIMDQYIVAMGAANEAMMLNCATLDFTRVRLPDGAQFLVVDSGVKRRLVASAYNARRQQCASALQIVQTDLPQLKWLADLNPDELAPYREKLSEVQYRRSRHVVSENRRVLEAWAALRGGDLQTLGGLLRASHESLRDDYEVSCQELDQLVEISDACSGVLGSRMMGAGFGGCSLSLVRSDAMEETMQSISKEYGKALGRKPWMHAVQPPDPVRRLSDQPPRSTQRVISYD